MKSCKFVVIGDLPLATQVLRYLLKINNVEIKAVLTQHENKVFLNDPWKDNTSLFDEAIKLGIPIYKSQKDLIDQFTKGYFDFGISCRASIIYKSDFILLFNKYLINMHGGLLPSRAGVNIACHSILEKDKTSGGTLHVINEKVDEGDIFARNKFSISSHHTAYDVYKKTQLCLLDIFKKNIENIISGKQIPIPQDYFIKRGEKRKYFKKQAVNEKREIKLYNITKSDIVNHVRGFDFPGHEPTYFLSKNTKIYLTSQKFYLNYKNRKTSYTQTPPTPCIKYDNLSKRMGINLWVKHDDYYPLYGGGNKARKLPYILSPAKYRGCNAIVTSGGSNSNHVRATAIACAQLGWKAILVIHSKKRKILKGNLKVAQLCDAEIRFVSKSKVSGAMNQAMTDLTKRGYKPYYIWGGGHNVQGTIAYYLAINELKQQMLAKNYPDYILLASGTGTTQAGIIAGSSSHFPATKVFGISVSYKKVKGYKVLKKLLFEFNNYLNKTSVDNYKIYFDDNFVGDGYESVYTQLITSIKNAATIDGLVLDTTYTGKAFFALERYIKKGKIQPGSNVLFWHTGSFLNLL